MVFRDLDGTTAQQANTSIITSHPFLKTPGDYQPSNWTNVFRSIRKFAYTTLNAGSFLPNEAFVDMTVTREKAGELSTSVFYNHSFDVQVELPLIVNEDYYYTYQFHTMPTNYFRYGIGNVAVGDFVRLRFRDFGKAPNLAITSNASVTKVYSKAAVDNASTSAYFADTSTGDLWVKWFNYSTGAHDTTHLDVTWSGTFTPTPADTDGDGMGDYKEVLAGRDPFNSRDLAFDFNTDNDFEGWLLNGMQAYIVNGGYQLSRTAGFGNLTRSGLAINGSHINSIIVSYQSEATGTLRLYWATSENNSFSENRALNATSSYLSGSGFVTALFDLSGNLEWIGKNITTLRLDTFGAAGQHTWIDYIRASGSSSQSLLELSSAPFIYLPTDVDTLLKPTLSSAIQSNGMRRSAVSIDAHAGTTYRLMASPDLSPRSWHEVKRTAATLTERIELEHDSDAPKQFYRIEYDLPVIDSNQ